jgi:hypothetical protein
LRHPVRRGRSGAIAAVERMVGAGVLLRGSADFRVSIASHANEWPFERRALVGAIDVNLLKVRSQITSYSRSG